MAAVAPAQPWCGLARALLQEPLLFEYGIAWAELLPLLEP